MGEGGGGPDLLFRGALEPDFMFRNKNRARRARKFLGTFELNAPARPLFFHEGVYSRGRGGWGGWVQIYCSRVPWDRNYCTGPPMGFHWNPWY